MNFLVTTQIGPRRSLLPNGALLCSAVPLARTGVMYYRNGELLDKSGKPQLSDGPEGYIQVERHPEEVFSPVSLASYNGSAFVDEHPREWVTPQNWSAYGKGYVLNPRRGDGDLSEWVVGDIIVNDPHVIAAIDAGKREVSVGYDAEYDEIEPGRARQRDIIVNHVALVKAGRCGSSCSIGDSQTEIPEMTTAAKDALKSSTASFPIIIRELLAKARRSMASKDEAGAAANLTAAEALTEAAAKDDASALTAGGPNATEIISPPAQPENHIHLHVGDEFPPTEKKDKTEDDDRFGALEKRMDATDAAIKGIGDSLTQLIGGNKEKTTDADEPDAEAKEELKKEAPGTKDSAMTTDSAFLADAFTNVVSLAEVIMPGIKAPTFDAKAKPLATFDSMCGHRRASLSSALSLSAVRPVIAGYIATRLASFGGLTIDKLSCSQTRDLFVGAAALQAGLNNGQRTVDLATTVKNAGPKTSGSGITSIAELNAANKAKYYPQAAKSA